MLIFKQWILGLCVALIPFLANAADEAVQEGKEYRLLPSKVAEAVANQDPNKIQVIEFFSYGCPGCNAITPAFNDWVTHQPTSVEVLRVPVVFHPSWELLARAFYTAKYLNVLDKMDKALFDAVHVQKLNLSNKDTIRKVFVDNGVKAADFDTTFDSFGVSHQLEQGQQLLQQYQIMAIPTVVVNNRYVTDLEMTRSPAKFTHVISVLAAEKSKSSASAPPH